MAKTKAHTPDPQRPHPDEPQQPAPDERPDRTDRREDDERVGDSALAGPGPRQVMVEKPNGHRTVTTERTLTESERQLAETPEQFARRSLGSDWNDRRQR